MGKQKFFNPVLILFFVILFFVPIYWSTHELTSYKSNIESRDIQTFPSLSYRDFVTSVKRILQGRSEEANNLFFYQFLTRSYQKEVQSAAADQFPIRMTAIRLSKAIDRGIIALSYALLPDPAIPSDMQSGFYITQDRESLIDAPVNFNASTKNRIIKKAEEFDTLLKNNNDLNVYLFYHQRLTYSSVNPLNQYFKNADQGRAFEYFESIAPAELPISKMMLTSYADYEAYYYRTDHHMNVYGVAKAYTIIYEMLAKDYPEISPRVNTEDIITFPDLEILGSTARQSLYPIKGEEFQVLDGYLPPFKIIEDGEEKEYTLRANYLAGDYSKDPFFNHYGRYFGLTSQTFLDYAFETGSDQNLLIIGSSFSRPLLPLIASHFHHTYYVDRRYNPDFSISEFLSEHPINSILYIADNSILFNETNWTIIP